MAQIKSGLLPILRRRGGSKPPSSDLFPDTIATAESWGSPNIEGGLNVFPDSIASAEAWGSLTIVEEQFVSPDSIPTAEAWGGPNIIKEQFVSPGTIATGESWGSPSIKGGLQISPGSIPSGEAWGTPDILIAHELTVSPGFIPATESWGTPNVCGPVNPGSIPAAEAWGTPEVNAEQTVSPGSIPATEAWGAPSVHFVETVSPGTITSAEAWGIPVASVVNRPVFPDAIPASEDWGTPDVNGGTLALQTFVGSYDRTPWEARGTLQIQSQTRGRWSGSVQFQNVPDGDMSAIDTVDEWRPLFGQTILCKEFRNILFRGCIRSIKNSRHLATNFVMYDCVLGDKSAICDHRIVTKAYQGSADGGIIWTIAEMVDDVIANFLNGEGISLGSDLTGEGFLDAATQPMISVTQLFDMVTTLTGLEWFIDTTQKLRFVEPDSAGVAPFEITETSKNWLNLTVEESDADFRTHQYVVSNRLIQPSVGAVPSITETYTLEDFGTGHVDYPDHMGFQRRSVEQYGFAPYTIVLNFGVGTIISVKVNGAAKPFKKYSDATEDDLFGVWLYDGNGAATIFASPYNAPGDIVEIIYTQYTPTPAAVSDGNLFVIEEPMDPEPGEQFGTCGSGRYDAVEQVNDVSTPEGMQAVADGLRGRLGVIPKTATFECLDRGAEVGQRIRMDVPRQNLNAEYLFITAITWKEETSGTDLGRGTSGRYSITAMSLPGLGNWVKRWELLYRRTEHPSPVTRVSPTTAYINGTVRAGNNITTPGNIPESGQLTRIVMKFDAAPTDQNLIFNILRNGVSILDSTRLVLADGAAADVILTTFATTTLYLAKDDTITLNAAYVLTGPNPTPARNITIQLQVVAG